MKNKTTRSPRDKAVTQTDAIASIVGIIDNQYPQPLQFTLQLSPLWVVCLGFLVSELWGIVFYNFLSFFYFRNIFFCRGGKLRLNRVVLTDSFLWFYLSEGVSETGALKSGSRLGLLCFLFSLCLGSCLSELHLLLPRSYLRSIRTSNPLHCPHS